MADCDVVDGCEGGVRCETTFCQAAETRDGAKRVRCWGDPLRNPTGMAGGL